MTYIPVDTYVLVYKQQQQQQPNVQRAHGTAAAAAVWCVLLLLCLILFRSTVTAGGGGNDVLSGAIYSVCRLPPPCLLHRVALGSMREVYTSE